MSWEINGNVLIACNCDYGCPCNFNALPTYGDCEGGWIWSIEKGTVDGVDLTGRSIAVFADWPKAIHMGGGKAGGYFDDGADDDQIKSLTRVLRGEVGGPWAMFINTYELDGPHSAHFEIDVKDFASTAVVTGVAELELQTIRNPVSGNEVHPEMVLPEGIIVKRAGLGASKVFRVHGDVAYDHSGKYAAFGTFAYSG